MSVHAGLFKLYSGHHDDEQHEKQLAYQRPCLTIQRTFGSCHCAAYKRGYFLDMGGLVEDQEARALAGLIF